MQTIPGKSKSSERAVLDQRTEGQGMEWAVTRVSWAEVEAKQ